MLYYSTEARISAINNILDLNAKISEIPGNVLSYEDSRAVSKYLSILIDEITKEEKRVSK